MTYLIFFIGTQNVIFEKIPWAPSEVAEVTLKPKTTKILNENSLKIDEIQNLASATLKMASSPRGPQKGHSEIFQKYIF